jgi:hypothetical protein
MARSSRIALACGSLLLLAAGLGCNSGSGEPATSGGPPRDLATFFLDPPTTANQVPTTAHDVPTPANDAPFCMPIACGTHYQCTVLADGQSTTSVEEVPPEKCSLLSSTFLCNHTYVDPTTGKVVGTWEPYGVGGFVATTTVFGQGQGPNQVSSQITCLPTNLPLTQPQQTGQTCVLRPDGTVQCTSSGGATPVAVDAG